MTPALPPYCRTGEVPDMTFQSCWWWCSTPLGYGTVLGFVTASTDEPKTYELHGGNIITVGAVRSRSSKSTSRQASSVRRSSESMASLSRPS